MKVRELIDWMSKADPDLEVYAGNLFADLDEDATDEEIAQYIVRYTAPVVSKGRYYIYTAAEPA